MLSMDEARARVVKGAALLDARIPGWHERVNIQTLNLAGCKNCIIGQVIGDYCDAVDIDASLRKTDVRMAHGFTANSGTAFGQKETWRRLESAWVDAIAARLHPDASLSPAPQPQAVEG